MRHRTADVMLLSTVTLWALNFTVSKYVLTHGLTPLAFSSTRYAAAAAIFIGITAVAERSLAVRARDLPLLLGCAVILFVNQLGFIYGLRFSSASTVALVFGTLPIFTVLIAAVVGVERLTQRFAAAALVSFVGVVLVALGSNGGLSADVKGDLLALLGVATWAAYSVAIAPLMERYSPYRISVVIISATALLLGAGASGQLASQQWPSGRLLWAGFAFAVLGPLIATNVLWFRAIHSVGPSRASMFANLQPFLAAVFALLLLSESLAWIQVVGGIAIAFGIVVSRRVTPAAVAVE